jgi:hypothetical protein
MGNKFSSGKHAIAECDKCGQRYKLKELKEETRKLKPVNNRVCPSCWDPDHPQLQLGMYPVEDPQAVRNPRPDRTYEQSGLLPNGYPGEGSRDIQWGWAPVGGTQAYENGVTPNYLVATTSVGVVTIAVT